MKDFIRLTESDLHELVESSARNIMNAGNQIALAQKELYRMGQGMSSVCLRLEGTKYETLSKRMKDATVALNNALIKDLRGDRE